MRDSAPAPDDHAIELAGYLHDTAVQESTAAVLMLELALADPGVPASVQATLAAAQDAVRASMQSIRTAIGRLDPEGRHTVSGRGRPPG